MTIYIQRRDFDSKQLETIDEFEERPEAFRCLKEYRFGDRAGDYYLSNRCCKAWKEADNG